MTSFIQQICLTKGLLRGFTSHRINKSLLMRLSRLSLIIMSLITKNYALMWKIIQHGDEEDANGGDDLNEDINEDIISEEETDDYNNNNHEEEEEKFYQQYDNLAPKLHK